MPPSRTVHASEREPSIKGQPGCGLAPCICVQVGKGCGLIRWVAGRRPPLGHERSTISKEVPHYSRSQLGCIFEHTKL